MKTFLMSLVLLLSINGIAHTQNLTLEWSNPGAGIYSSADFNICGAASKVDLRVSWNNDPNCPYPGWGTNRYRFTVELFKNNTSVSTRTFQTSSCGFRDIHYNFNLTPGTYRANIIMEVRGFFWIWDIQASGNTNSLIIGREAAVPGLTINGINPNPEIPLEVCPEAIIIDGSSTSCEADYWVGVWEFDYQNQNRPQSYEWGRWFSGQAPANLNLQQLSAQYSVGNDFRGNDNTRQGEILTGGLLPNNAPRYYRVEVCTGVPEWDCATAIILVKCDCS